MGIKKIALLNLVSLMTLMTEVTFAGDLEYPNMKDLSGFYIGVDLGGVYNTELDFPSSVMVNQGTSHTPWGFTVSGLMGYQFNSNWALQFGYIEYESQKLKQTATARIKYSKYNMYVAAKISVPLFAQMTSYALIGPAYTNENAYADIPVNNSTRMLKSIWTPMGALGVSYRVDENFTISAQYMFIMQDIRSLQTTNLYTNQLAIDSNTQRITLAVSYLFQI
jgi:opacity protein-like surface antigen